MSPRAPARRRRLPAESLMPLLAFRLAAPALLVNLRNIAGLDRILIGNEGVTLGARVR